jgi:hypothetical protein
MDKIVAGKEVRLVRKEEYGYFCAKKGKMQSFDQSNDPPQVRRCRLHACKHGSPAQNGTMDASPVSDPCLSFLWLRGLSPRKERVKPSAANLNPLFERASGIC